MNTIKLLFTSFLSAIVVSWVIALPFLIAIWLGWLNDEVYYNVIWPIIAFTVIPIGTISLFLQKRKEQKSNKATDVQAAKQAKDK
ncbi:hypothetical protein KJ705_04045 [Patescibacteria group bacterium]|nr:hypothetical protein [Patescibacteria group bacterium]MBU2235544.1 hypothetical protein [Patescibacteria group bacterium]